MQLKSLLTIVPFMLTMVNSVTSAVTNADNEPIPNKILKTDARRLSEVVDANNFCVYLPPKSSKNRNIADMEWTAEPFCMGQTPFANKAKANPMPEGFILSAHYLVTDAFVQITGQIDPAKANLNVTDEGGQMDVKAPNPSRCWGWRYYVNLIEPLGRTYCMRCCNDKKTCNRGISEKGCAHIIPGDYSGPLSPGGGNADDNKNGGAIVTTTTIATTPSSTGSQSATSTAGPASPDTKNPPLASGSGSDSSLTPKPTGGPSDTGNANNNNNGNGNTDSTTNTGNANNSGNANGDAKVSAQSVSGAVNLTSSMTLFTILSIVLSFLTL